MNEEYQVLTSPLPAPYTLQNARHRVKELLDQVWPGARLEHNGFGAPVLSNGVKISISHCREMVAIIGWTNNYMRGIDVETMRAEQLRRVAPKFLQPEEREFINTDYNLLKAWITKEAVYKAALWPSMTAKEIMLSPQWDVVTTPHGSYYVGYNYCDNCVMARATSVKELKSSYETLLSHRSFNHGCPRR